ncbi:cell division protein SepF [Candidatus Woesearchaeota archaeon]|nr:cell division protein SepF [Candidatus Woesearchaeota archaeon]
MAGFFSKFVNKFSSQEDKEDEVVNDDFEEDYVELDTAGSKDKKSKIIVRPYTIEDFSDIKAVLDALREGYTIALINIKPLREKDIVELKRAVGKLKKTCDAIEGDIAGFDEDYIIVTPSFAKIHREKIEPKEVKTSQPDDDDF